MADELSADCLGAHDICLALPPYSPAIALSRALSFLPLPTMRC